MPGINAFKTYMGGQIFSIFDILEGKMRSLIAFKVISSIFNYGNTGG